MGRVLGMMLAGLLFGFGAMLAIGQTPQDGAPDRKQQENATEKTIGKLNKQMDELAAGFRKAGKNTQSELNALFDEFKEKQAKARQELQEMRDATNEKWDVLKTRMNKSIDDLQGIYERAKSRSPTGNKTAAPEK
jgi:uncharacterized coiled-coil DUF342 family protein